MHHVVYWGALIAFGVVAVMDLATGNSAPTLQRAD